MDSLAIMQNDPLGEILFPVQETLSSSGLETLVPKVVVFQQGLLQ